MRGKMRREGGAVHCRGVSSVHKGEGPTGGQGAGHAAERTLNMKLMPVTLDVSRLSGWLNADAPCRVKKGGHNDAG